MTLRLVLAAAFLTLAANATRAADLPPADMPAEKVIDKLIDAPLALANVTPAKQLGDAAFIRRVTLDLVGRIPTPAETKAYVELKDANKRALLIDRLLASPGFARHQATMFEAMLNPDPVGKRGSGALTTYLTEALRENRPWDQIFRELMLPDETNDKMKGAADFLKVRLNDADRLTNDVSVAFFGVNVSCAQCHDHPLVHDWKQDHFYGMKSFFSRTYDAGGFLAERSTGLVKFKPNKGAEREAKLMFLTGTAVKTDTLREPTKDEQKAEKEASDKAKASKKAPPKPVFSARGQLVEVALKPENNAFFSRSIANRMWHRFFGVGLVSPLDQMHSENPPSHPELLAWLARDTANHGYDLKRLIRGIVMSQAYSRSSRYDTEAQPGPTTFAVAQLKPLTPMQLAASLKIATADPAYLEGKPDEIEKRIEQLEQSSRGFASLIAQPNDNFQIGVGEALLFSNGDRLMKDFLGDAGNTLLGKLKTEKDPNVVVDMLVFSAFGREPSNEERTAFTAFLAKRADRAAEANRQLLWALLTSPEFRFAY